MKNTKFVVLAEGLRVRKTGARHTAGQTVDLGHLSADERQTLVDLGHVAPATSDEAAAVVKAVAGEKEA